MLFLVIQFLTNFVLVYGILGGYQIRIHNAPYQISYGDQCGGALIHKRFGLTSAHCGTDHTFIRIGSTYRLKGPKVTVVSHIIHPKYGQMKHSFDYDVQILRLLRGLYFGKLVSPIPISEQRGVFIFVSGWGYHTEKGDYQEKLQQVMLRIIPKGECQEVDNKWYNHTLTPRMFCAGGWGMDACQGDSGGAAVSLGKLIGLSSFGFGCGRSLPGVYTNISDPEIRKWIRYHTGV